MVRTYIRKGGDGGDRSKAGLPAGYWQDKGGRAAAAAAKAAVKAKELLEEQAAKAAATNHWKQWAKHSDEQQSTSNQLHTVQCPPCEPRLTPRMMTTQRVLVDDSRVLRRVV
jgi:hypothetical protein